MAFNQNIHIEEDVEERLKMAWEYQPSDGGVYQQKFVVMCVVAPEGVNQKCSDLAVKIFGCFPSKEDADKYAKKLSSECDAFDYFVATTCDWLKLPPQVQSIDDVHYQDRALSDIQNRLIDMRTARAKLLQDRIASDKEARKNKQTSDTIETVNPEKKSETKE